jgi:dihydroxyacid dehydratase/phosphogluconate dehydratase
VVSLGETQVRPTATLWRNMAAIATEEMLRANPIDGVVLLGGCDKTIPSLLMAAASVDLPAVVVPGGPMLTGTFRGVPLGCGTDVWRLSEEVRAGTLSAEQFTRSGSAMIRSRGHCNTMGTASTIALVAKALGTVVPGVAGTPAADNRLLEAAHGTGRLVVEMVAADRRPSTFLTHASFANAIVTMAAVGGSTNAVVHLPAIAGRLGIDLTLDDFDRIGSYVPLLVDLQPAGRFLMDVFHRAGGLLPVLREVRDLLDPTAVTVTGRPLVDYLDAAPIRDPEVIRLRRQPLLNESGIAVLRGNLTPAGAIINPQLPPRTSSSTADALSSSTVSRTSTPASTILSSMSMRTPCWCCAAAGRRATPGCLKSRTCRCRRSCSRRASAIWCVSATAG